MGMALYCMCVPESEGHIRGVFGEWTYLRGQGGCDLNREH